MMQTQPEPSIDPPGRRRACGCRNDHSDARRALNQRLRSSRVADSGEKIRIGIVFHICYRNYTTESAIADVDHAIQSMNADFARTCSNYDCGANTYTSADLRSTYASYVALASASNVEFYLVSIKYKPLAPQTSSNISVLDRSIKGSSPPVDPEKYLNIWVADISGGLLGYAQFPWEESPSTDGVVIARGAFGRNPTYEEFNLNKTMTHEVGHWLGLYHTFQETFAYDGGNIDYRDGTSAEELQERRGDCVVDTPPQADPTSGNPLTTPNTWPSSRPSDEGRSYRHMYMNFMDYSDDAALFMFTKDQVDKFRQMIYIYRPGVVNVSGPTPVPTPTPTPAPAPAPTPAPATFQSVSCDFDKPSVGLSRAIVYAGNTLLAKNSEVSTQRPASGTKSLRTRRSGHAEFSFSTSGARDLTLSFNALVGNSDTYLWVRSPGSSFWRSVKLPLSTAYRSFSFGFPTPYSVPQTSGSIDTTYFFRLGTNGSSAYSYFDDIKIVNAPSAPTRWIAVHSAN